MKPSSCTGLDAPWAKAGTLTSFSRPQNPGDSVRDHSDAFTSKTSTDETDIVLMKEAVHDTILAHPAALSTRSEPACDFISCKTEGGNLASADPLHRGFAQIFQGAV
jgi:hypothetical protein